LIQRTSPDTEQLRALAHELAEALRATRSYLRAGQQLANQETLRKTISKAIQQTHWAERSARPLE